VNDSGVAVGLAIFNPWGTSAAVFTSGGIAIDLGTLGGASSQANAINNNGQIVGYSNTVNSNFHPEIHATLFNIGGSPIDLGTLGGNWSSADAINNSGQIVGYSSIYENSPVHATLFDSGAGPIDLGVLDGYSGSLAEGINDSGQIIGRSYLRDLSGALYGYQATLFDIGDIPMGLGSLGGNYSYANGINNQGQIVGYSSRPGDLDIRATIFGYGISPIDLNDLIDPLSGWTLQHATAINSNGDIVGYGLINGQTRAFLASPVPEPATLLLLGIGFVGLGFTKISRKS
jgi:probable HAF family extracellular repeat protein